MALRHPEVEAVVDEGRVASYAELERRSNQLAHHIRSLHLDPARPIAVALPRGIPQVEAVLAVAKLGVGYLPLDLSYPPDRIRFMLEQAHASCVITEGDVDARGSALLRPSEVQQDVPSTPIEDSIGSDALLYVIFTSGSTGEPKGVAMVREPLEQLLEWQAEQSGVRLGRRTLQFSPLSFDVSAQEIFGTLSTGGTLVLVSDQVRRDGARLLGHLIRFEVERLFLPFVALQSLCDAALASEHLPERLNEVITAGEQLQVTPSLVRFFEGVAPCRLINQYGPSETHVVTAHELEGPPSSWPSLPPIGEALPHVRCYVLDDEGHPVAPGAEGELFLGGHCLARGYIERPELTAERFLPDPFSSEAEACMYRTGDLVREGPGGVIRFLGRRDGQVKVRGHRVELAELEVCLGEHPQLRQVAVTARRKTEEAPLELVAYLVAHDGPRPTPGELRRFVLARLPDYMCPGAWVFLPELPRTPSGKVDRGALPAPTRARPELGHPLVPPEGPTETAVCRLWSEILDVDPVGAEDDFFELGGNSLLAVRFVAELEARRGVKIPVVKLFERSTPAGLRAWIESGDRRPLRRRRRVASQERPEIALVGWSGRFPGARSIDELWAMLMEGAHGIRFLSPDELDPSVPQELRTDSGYVPARGLIDGVFDFDPPLFGMNPKEAAMVDPQQRLLLRLAWESLEDAGHDPERFRGDIGVYCGVRSFDYYLHHVRAQPEKIESYGAFNALVANDKDYVATRIAHRLGLTGPALSIFTACSTGLVGLHQAVRALRSYDCDMALAGAASLSFPQRVGHLYSEGSMLSADGLCSPFDAQATGTTFNDGGVMVVLRRLDEALRDGDRVLAVVKGSAINNDGAGKSSFTAPSVEGQARVLAAALDDAEMEPDEVGYVEAHGTATPLGDPIEVEALVRAYGRADAPRTQLGSIKSNIGHMTSAAGLAGLVKASRAVSEGWIPGTRGFTALNPRIDLGGRFEVRGRGGAWPEGPGPRRAGVSSFGVGGTNAHVLIEEAPVQVESEPGRGFDLFLLSARSDEALSEQRSRLSQVRLETSAERADAAFTLHAGRRQLSRRWAAVVPDAEGLGRELREGGMTGASAGRPPGLAFVFPGQGTQTPGMGRQLYEAEPTFRAVVDRCAELLRPHLDAPLLEVLHPVDPSAPAAAERLRRTEWAQPAIFVVSYALAELWKSWGLRPAVMVGHSVGEFVAAALTGVFRLEDALQAVAARGRLMQSMPPGAMLSVRAPLSEVEPYLDENVELAAHNGQRLCVVAGPEKEVARVQAALQAQEIPAKPLHTSHAFHTRMMEDAVDPFRDLLQGMELGTPDIEIISTVTGQPLRAEEATDLGYWSRHLRVPVRFAPAAQSLAERSSILALGCGPGGTMPALIKASVGGALPAVASLKAKGHEVEALLQAAGRLWCAGVDLDAEAMYVHQRRRRRPLPTYPFEDRRCCIEVSAPVAPSREPAAAPATESTVNATNDQRKLQLLGRVRELIEDASGFELENMEPNDSFIDLGLDSLLLTQLATTLKKSFGVAITFRQLNEDLASPAAVVDRILAELPPEEAPAAPSPAEAPSAPEAPPPAAAPSPVAAPLVPAPISSPAAPVAADESVQGLIQQQLEIMSRQLQLMGGVAPAPPATASAPTPQVSPPAPPPSVPSSSSGANGAERGARPSAASNGSSARPPGAAAEKAKAFGAQTRITKERSEATQLDPAALEQFMARYVARTAKSKSYTQQHRAHLADPRAVSGFRPELKEITYPIVVERSKGARLWDIDGNEYIDLASGFGSCFLGHGSDVVKQAVMRQLEEGIEVGPQHPLAGEVAAKLVQMVGHERVAFCNTGSEAVLGAVRTCRTVTGNSLVVMFEGAYHGINDEVVVRGTPSLQSMPAAAGVPREAVANTLILPYGDQESLAKIGERMDDLACVLIEPVQSRRPDLQPQAFLRQLREMTEEADVPIIFDEVITGFRIGSGGAQAHFGVKADLGTYGKVVGGGLPIGVIAGRAKYMDALDGGFWQFGDDGIPEAGVTYFAGTFVRHPAGLAAAKAMLTHIEREGPALYEKLNQRTDAFVGRLASMFEASQAPVKVKNFGSLFKITVTDPSPFGALFFHALRLHGVHVWDGRPCFLTTAHGDEEIQTLHQAFERALADTQRLGVFPWAEGAGRSHASTPPSPGARLGKDPDGTPAWYAPDPARPGKYVRVAPA